MKQQEFILIQYDADDGFVFDWREPRFIEVEIEGNIQEVQEHLYVKTMFIGEGDSIDNYIEVPEPVIEE